MKFIYNFPVIRFLIIFSLGKLYNVTALFGPQVESVDIDELPFVASLSLDKEPYIAERHICTGVLISEKLILTARHCAVLLDQYSIVIRIGSPSLSACEKYNWETWVPFETWATENNFSVDVNHDDIAIIKLVKRVENVQPAKLYSPRHAIKHGSKLYVAGWGKLENGSTPDYLQKVSVKVLSREECERRTVYMPDKYFNWQRRICTKADAISGFATLGHGDSGGPLYDEYYRVVGINIGIFPVSKNREDQVNDHCTVMFYRNFLSDSLNGVEI